MELQLFKGEYLSLKGYTHKTTYLDKSDFEKYSDGAWLVRFSNGEIHIVPEITPELEDARNTYFYLPKVFFDAFAAKISSRKLPNGITASFISKRATFGVLWSEAAYITGLRGDIVGPIRKFPPIPPQPIPGLLSANSYVIEITFDIHQIVG